MDNLTSTPFSWYANATRAITTKSNSCTRNFSQVGFIPIAVFIVGMIGNTLTFITANSYRRESTVGILIKALAVCDNITLILVQMVHIWLFLKGRLRPDVYQSVRRVKKYITPVAAPFLTASALSSTWVVVVIGLHRYMAVIKPLHVFTFSSPRRTKFHIMIAVIFSFICAFPRFFEFRLNCGSNSSGMYTSTAENMNKNGFILEYAKVRNASASFDNEHAGNMSTNNLNSGWTTSYNMLTTLANGSQRDETESGWSIGQSIREKENSSLRPSIATYTYDLDDSVSSVVPNTSWSSSSTQQSSRCRFKKWITSVHYQIWYRDMFLYVVNSLLPFGFLLFFTARVLTTVHKNATWRRRASNVDILPPSSRRLSDTHSRSDSSTTTMLVAVMVIQIIFVAFHGMAHVLSFQFYHRTKCVTVFFRFKWYVEYLYLINYADNFFIYVLFGKTFRDAFIKKFRSKNHDKPTLELHLDTT